MLCSRIPQVCKTKLQASTCAPRGPVRFRDQVKLLYQVDEHGAWYLSKIMTFLKKRRENLILNFPGHFRLFQVHIISRSRTVETWPVSCDMLNEQMSFVQVEKRLKSQPKNLVYWFEKIWNISVNSKPSKTSEIVWKAFPSTIKWVFVSMLITFQTVSTLFQ